MPGFQWHCGTTISGLIHYRNTFGEVSYGGDYPRISITVVPMGGALRAIPATFHGWRNERSSALVWPSSSPPRVLLHGEDLPALPRFARGYHNRGLDCRSLHAHERLVVLVAEVPRRLALLDPRIPHHRIRKVLRLHANGLFTRWVHHAKLRGDRQVDAVNLTRENVTASPTGRHRGQCYSVKTCRSESYLRPIARVLKSDRRRMDSRRLASRRAPDSILRTRPSRLSRYSRPRKPSTRAVSASAQRKYVCNAVVKIIGSDPAL